jgi:F0F1-type ATP synthase membrane subunit b/b'
MEKAETHARVVDAQIEELRAQAAEARAEIKIEYEKRLEALDPVQKRAQNKLREIQRNVDDMLDALEANVIDVAVPPKEGNT